jgi:hypothetical protein
MVTYYSLQRRRWWQYRQSGHNTARHGTAQHSTAQHSTARPGTRWPGNAQHSIAHQRAKAAHAPSSQGWRGRQGAAQHGPAMHSTAQQRTKAGQPTHRPAEDGAAVKAQHGGAAVLRMAAAVRRQRQRGQLRDWVAGLALGHRVEMGNGIQRLACSALHRVGCGGQLATGHAALVWL